MLGATDMRFLLNSLRRPPDAAKPAPHPPLIVEIDGDQIQIQVKSNARARRMTLKFDNALGDFIVTMPPRTSLRQAERFARSHQGWMMRQLEQAHTPVPFAPGAVVPLRGRLHVIRHSGLQRGMVRTQAADMPGAPGIIWVSGDLNHLSRRVGDWLKREARADLQACARHYADAMGVSYQRVSLRDQKSRWGSCSTSGTLSFSWRLILAPEDVLDYVAAHEVAHIVHMNHGRDFWALVERHVPEMPRARAWLKTHGAALHRYGQKPRRAASEYESQDR